MSAPDLAAIHARAAAAIGGSWEANTDHHQRGIVSHSVWVEAAGTYAAEQCPDAETAAFIAHARADVPALLAEVERLREVLSWTLTSSSPEGIYAVVDAALGLGEEKR